MTLELLQLLAHLRIARYPVRRAVPVAIDPPNELLSCGEPAPAFGLVDSRAP